MTEGPHPSQVKAGKIAARVLKEIEKDVTPKTKVFTICSLVEKKIVEYGARPAFPCNVSIDNIAAHYTSPIGDTSTIPESGLVKIDLGAQIDGYITDMARTFDIDGTFEGFVVATDDALQEAITMMRPGTSLGDIGKTIEKVIGAICKVKLRLRCSISANFIKHTKRIFLRAQIDLFGNCVRFTYMLLC